MAAVAPALAQNPTDPGSTLQVFTRLVVLDVVVLDKKGVPVLDLTKDDFKVYEGNLPQPVRSVEPPSAHALPGGEIVHSAADLGKIGSSPVNIMVLDFLNTPFEDNAYTRYSALRYLKAQPAVMAPTTLLATTNNSFTLLHDYTQDAKGLEAAIKKEPADYPWKLMRNGNGGTEGVIRFQQTLSILQQIAQASAGTPGRKNLIWVGRGFPSVNLDGLDDDVAQPVKDAMRRCTDLLMSNRMTLYVVDPTPLSSAMYDNSGGPVSPEDLKEETGIEPFSDAVSFDSLAPVTGGRVFAARNDVDAEIGESIRDGSSYYTLAYRPAQPPTDEETYRHIHIFVDRPELTVLTRDGYYAQAPREDTAAAKPEDAKAEENHEVLDVAGAALSKMTYNGVKLRAGKGDGNVVNLAIADASLTWKPEDSGGSSAVVSIVAVCFNAKGKVLSHTAEDKKLVSAEPNKTAGREEIVAFPLVPPAGTTRVRFIVRDAASKRLGSAEVVGF